MTTDEHQESLNIHRAYLVNCKQLEKFIQASVEPIIKRRSNGMAHGKMCVALMQRVQKWLETISRLNSSDDFQAVHAASRSIFETSIDLVLIFHEEKGSVRKLLGWQESSKLRAFERLRRLAPDAELLSYIRLNEASILAEREALWGLNRKGEPNAPERWTQRNLEQDAIKAESYFSGGFLRFYAERYASTCWYVHGSGVTGVWDLPEDRFSDVCSLALRDAHNFGLVCVEYSLKLLDAFDEISEERFKRLQRKMTGTFDAIWKQYDR